MLNTLNVNLNTDLKVTRVPELSIKIKSQDINNNLFILRFTDKGKTIELDETYTVEILTKFEKSKSHRLTSATIFRDYARWEFDTSFITQDEKVTNYVYVRKAGSLVVSADANAFAFDVGLSEIDKDAGRVAEVYDENYEKYLDEFKENVDFEDIAQAEQARKDAEILRQESYDTKVDTAIVEADVVNKVDNKVTELTPQINDLTAQLAQKATKGEVSSADLSVATDKDKIKLINLSDEVQQAMSGDAPTLDVISNGAVVAEKIPKNAIKTYHNSSFKTGKNLYNKDDATTGAFVEALDGTVKANANFACSDYIPVLANAEYTRQYPNQQTIFFDNNYKFISAISAPNTGTFTTPSNCSFLRMNMAVSIVDTEQLEIGAVKTPIEPYHTRFKNEFFDRTIKRDALPFAANASDMQGETEIRKAVKQIALRGIDVSKKYCLGTISRNFQTYGTGASIYECDENGVGSKIVATSHLQSHSQSDAVELFKLFEYNNSGITADVYVDWNEVTSGKQYINMNYAKSGLDVRTYEVSGDDGFDISLPPKIYGLTGEEINIYFDNISLCSDISAFQFDVVSDVGTQQNERWTYTPPTPGVHSLAINVYKDGLFVTKATTSLVVTSSGVGLGANRRCLFIGDSTTDAGVYTQELLNLQADDVMSINLVGGRGISPNVHEGRGGWTISQYYTDSNSPFVFDGTFDFSQYMSTKGYSNIDYVGIHLGINDMFGHTTDASVNLAISNRLGELNAMISSIIAYSDTVKIGLMVTIPPSFNQDAFGKNYGSGQTRWRYKRNNYLWVKEFMNYFKDREDENIHLVPIHTNLDTQNNMESENVAVNSRNSKVVSRQSNGVHPAPIGYHQMADALWYWLKSFEVS